jgi:7,8-dihydropterin-6-yl-methyl-4-(beta-D-ribofuranosyl)aminobenzene 5'-phosphate synthase
MGQIVRITILADNTAARADLNGEHGLSLWIEYEEKHILFDTGQSDLLIRNARQLGIDLTRTDAVILSHGHYDHTGGLSSVVNMASKVTICLHPAATEPKFSQGASTAKSIGMPDSAKKTLQRCHVIWTVTPAQLLPGMSVTGQVPRMNDFEDVGGAFFLDESCQKPDELRDDQTLLIESAKGLVAVLGCAHSGVVNILDYIGGLTGQKKVYALIGGMHLRNASPMRIANTIRALKKNEIQEIAPLHCTGQRAVEDLRNAFGDKCLLSGAGRHISF